MRILVIGDTHFPAVHPGYFSFCQDLASANRCDTFVHIGDVVDWHAISFHKKHPDAPGALDEFEQAKQYIRKWNKAFPKMKVCEGNHDARIARLSADVGIPQRFLRGYNDLWETPHWQWSNEWKLDGTYFFHGTGVSGAHPAFNTMQKMLMSTVMGHIHSVGGIQWRANPERRIFGMDTGCGVDDKHVALAYGEHLKVRSILSAGVVVDGVPIHVIMKCGHGEKYHKSRFAKRQR